MLAGAVVLGSAAHFLVAEGTAWRLGLSLWIVLALAIAGAAVLRRRDAQHGPGRSMLWGISAVILLGALGFILRDAEALYALGFLGTLLAAALLAWQARSATESLTRLPVLDLIRIPVQAGASAAFGAPLLAAQSLGGEAADGNVPSTEGRVRRTQAIIGVVVAIPVVLLLGALLVASDPVFEGVTTRWLALPYEAVLERMLLIGFFTWVGAGWLRSFVRPVPLPNVSAHVDTLRPSAAFTLLAPMMYGVFILLAIFLAVQARALFGGAAYVEMTSGLSYAQYAREGFFGLVVVAALVLAILVGGDWLVGASDSRDVSRFRQAGWGLVALVLVMLASSAQRLALYMAFFGLTDARLYAAAFTVAVALALAWAGFTVLRGRRDAFAAGLLAVGLSTVVALHVINPERVVVQVNAARAAAGEVFDIEYHASLSADALAALGVAARVLPGDQCASLLTGMHGVWTKRLSRTEEAGVGGWSLPRRRAVEWLEEPLDQRVRTTCGG